MFCPKDGTENREGATRCRTCGDCLNCGERDPGGRFCKRCRIPMSNLCPRGLHSMDPTWTECVVGGRTRILPLGPAPDGLPFHLFIDTGPTASELLEPLGRHLNKDNGENTSSSFEDVRKQVDELLHRQTVRLIQAGDQELECYISAQPARAIFGATLLERILGGDFAGRRADTRSAPAREPTRPAGAGLNPRRPPVGVGHLAMPLQGGSPILVTRTASSLAYDHVYEPESMQSLTTARFEIHVFPQGEHHNGPMRKLDTYREARARAFAADEAATVQCTVDRNEVAQLIARLARQTQHLHQRGEVHGDLKPANALITQSGVVLIDSLQVRPAQYSPAMTPGWAAPEQVIGEPVSFASDQYPLGVMLSRLLGAVIYGEEVTHRIPGGGDTLDRFTLLRNPGAYLDASSGTVAEDGIEPWRSVVDRCLRFRPEYRHGTVGELAAKIDEVAADHPLLGTCSVDLTFGQLTGTPELGWQLYDIRGDVPWRRSRAPS
jgi:protein kinase-like protein